MLRQQETLALDVLQTPAKCYWCGLSSASYTAVVHLQATFLLMP